MSSTFDAAVSIYENGWGGARLQDGLPEKGPYTRKKIHNYMFLIEFRSLCFCYSVKGQRDKRRHSYRKKCIENVQNI